MTRAENKQASHLQEEELLLSLQGQPVDTNWNYFYIDWQPVDALSPDSVVSLPWAPLTLPPALLPTPSSSCRGSARRAGSPWALLMQAATSSNSRAVRDSAEHLECHPCICLGIKNDSKGMK